MIDIISELQTWYTNTCDGEWEHGSGIRIETLDNPGWSVEIDLRGTALVKMTFDEIDINRDESNWIRCRITDGMFEGFGGSNNLAEVIAIFLSWSGKGNPS